MELMDLVNGGGADGFSKRSSIKTFSHQLFDINLLMFHVLLAYLDNGKSGTIEHQQTMG